MESLLVQYGYALLFLGVAFEGEAVLLAAALLAQRGIFHIAVVIVVAVAANSVADQVYYQLARLRGRHWLERRFGAHPRYQQLLDLVGRRGGLLLLASRFAYGFRIAIPAACGALGMGVVAFTLLDLLAGLLWALPMAALGFFAGGALGPLLEGVRSYEEGIALLLVIAVAAFLGFRHVRRTVRWRELQWGDLHALVPFVVGLLGALNVLSAISPREPAVMRTVQQWLPLGVTQRSRALMLLAGIALLQITRNLGRRKAGAWWAAVGALLVSLLSHVGRAFDLHHSLVAALLLGYLVAFRRRFTARSDPASLRQAVVMAPILAATVWVFGVVGLSDLRDEFAWYGGNTPAAEAVRSGLLIADPAVEPATEHAARFLGALQIAGWASRFYLLVLVLRPVILRRREEVPREVIARAVREHGRRSLSAFVAQDDKHHLLVAGGRGLVAYAVRGHVAFAAGDPLCPDDDLEGASREWLEHCRHNGWTPCVYEAAEEVLPVYHRLGLRSLKMAEEAIVDLASFSLAGGRRAALRSMVHKVARMGLTVRRYDRARAPEAAVDEALEEISEEWLSEKRLGEMGFSLGRFSLESLGGPFVFICLDGVRVVAFTTWRPYRGGRAALLDLMRRRRDTPSGTMDLLIARALEELGASGLEEASLANAPLANVGEPRGGIERGVALLFENLNAFYGYKNLFQFKKKFAPRWEGRYLVHPGRADLPRVAYALAGIHGAGGLRRLVLGR
ncbi:MAG TPA: phosphatidylglycerol lysyltransferase domain-containing protein [Vicinamibacteria bacterium]|nr:phosphatidylglycerol lysyltransferase domain-containing protein [Vicinamibacteria bacterium]